MRKRLLVMINILVLLVSVLNPDIAFAKTDFREASIEAIEGTVKVIISGGQKEYNAYKGMGLTQGDTVITSENSSVTLYIDEDKEIKLGENSKLTLSELSNYIDSQSKSTGLKLWVGKIFVNVKKKLNIRSKFEITTGSTVMGVKGTQFYVGYEAFAPISVWDTSSISSLPLWNNYRTDLVVLSGTVSAMVPPPPSGIQGGFSPIGHTLDVHANQRIEFTEDEMNQTQGIQVQPIQPQDLDLLVLEQIAANPQSYDESLVRDLELLLRHGREEAERERIEREEMLKTLQEMRQIQAATHMQPYLPPPPPIPPQTLYTPPSIPAPPAPSLPPFSSTTQGNETVVINYPTNTTSVNTMQGVNLELTATNNDNDLNTVKVSVRNEQGYYLSTASGDFTSSTPVYLNATKNNSKWYLLLNGTPFTTQREYVCTVNAIAYDGVDGTPSTVQFRVDNAAPELLVSNMPMELYPNTQGQTKPIEAVLRFTKKLSTTGKTSVENELKSAVIIDVPEISGIPPKFGSGEDLNFSWTYDDSQKVENLTVTIRTDDPDNPTPLPVFFKNVENITATIEDLNGHVNTVVLYEVETIPMDSNTPRYVQLEKNEEMHRYYTSTIQYYVPLPVGMDIADFSLQGEEWNNYISLGGVLAGNTVAGVSTESINNQIFLRVVCKGDVDYDNNMWVNEGQGSIIVSNLVMRDMNDQDDNELPSVPICASVTLSKEAFCMSHQLSNIDGMEDPTILEVEWDVTKGLVSWLYITENSSEEYQLYPDEATELASGTVINLQYLDTDQDGLMDQAYISGLTMNQDYWIRGYIDEGDYRGYTKVLHYSPGELSAMTLNQAMSAEKILSQQLSSTTIVSVDNPNVVDARLELDLQTVIVKGIRPGTTRVTVSSEISGESITYYFDVTVSEPTTVIQATAVTPSAITLTQINGESGAYIQEFIVELPEGYNFTPSLEEYEQADNYIWFGGQQWRVSINMIENHESLSNIARIKLNTFDDSGTPYVKILETGVFDLIISGLLLEDGNQEKVIKANITVQ